MFCRDCLLQPRGEHITLSPNNLYMLQIETGIPMPTTKRAAKGDSRLNAIKEGLEGLTKKGQSFLLAMDNYEQATEERRHYVNRAGTYGKAHKKEFIIAAVDGSAAVPADETKGIAEKPMQPAGLRFWLAANLNSANVAETLPPADTDKRVIVPGNTVEGTGNEGQEAAKEGAAE